MEDIREFVEENLTEVIFVAAMVGIVAFLFVLILQPTHIVEMQGYLLGKEYTPSSTDVGVGSGVDSSGKPTTVVVTSSNAETWKLVLQQGDEVHTWGVSPQTFYRVEVNTNVVIQCREGNWFPIILSCI